MSPARNDAARLLRLGAVLGYAAAPTTCPTRASPCPRRRTRRPPRTSRRSRGARRKARPHLRSAREWQATASRRPTRRSVASTTSSSTIRTGRSSCSASTPAWLPGRKVVVSPGWLRGVDWAGHRIEVDLSRQQIEDSPEYDFARVPRRDFPRAARGLCSGRPEVSSPARQTGWLAAAPAPGFRPADKGRRNPLPAPPCPPLLSGRLYPAFACLTRPTTLV